MGSKKKNYQSFGGFGVDISLNRIDDLDRKILSYIEDKNNVKILNLGSGMGWCFLSKIKPSNLVTAVDIFDFSEAYKTYREKNGWEKENLQFVQGDIHSLENILTRDKVFDIAVLQRVLHYMSFLEAKKLLRYLSEIVVGKLYFSVSGMGSDLGKNYQGQALEIKERFVVLDENVARIFQVSAPVCLYKKEEVVELLKETDWGLEELWVSAFGNIKAICFNKRYL